jgi:radical SAM protein with 4Fe4S-binding SPASM domain
MLQINHYKKEHYSTIFNPDTGFFARVEDKGHPEPLWSQHGPELLDISITGWCDRECPDCYRSSGTQGKHLDLSDFEIIIRQAKRIGVSQIALGGGNPNEHPEFPDILKLSRKEFGIIPSYSTNGRGLSPSVIEATAECCGAVAVSAYKPYVELESAIRKLIVANVRTNVHFVLNSESLNTALSWLHNPPRFLNGVNAIIFLNYKPVGRQSSNTTVLLNSPCLEEFFTLVQEKEYPFRIGFDSCMVSGLVSYTTINHCFYDACEAARFSMYISEDMLMYPCSFMENITEGIPVENDNILDVWKYSSLFCSFREALLAGNCPECPHRRICLGGCPVFKDIRLCGVVKGIARIQQFEIYDNKENY